MSRESVHILELNGWGFDTYEHRPVGVERSKSQPAASIVAQRHFPEQSNVLLAVESEKLNELFAAHSRRTDLLSEMSGLSWTLGVVDLRALVAFQRRLAFDRTLARTAVPAAGDWPALVGFSFGSPKPVEYELTRECGGDTILLRSGNPNLHVRVTQEVDRPLGVHGGGPFFEVARLRNRWFLRDGYHRAYELLASQVYRVPAVIVEAASMQELGAAQPWFFPEDVLFSDAPPLVSDFLNKDLVLEYDRPPLIKTVRIRIEETLQPDTCTGERS